MAFQTLLSINLLKSEAIFAQKSNNNRTFVTDFARINMFCAIKGRE